jgi:hypothetical protein
MNELVSMPELERIPTQLFFTWTVHKLFIIFFRRIFHYLPFNTFGSALDKLANSENQIQKYIIFKFCDVYCTYTIQYLPLLQQTTN